VGEPRCVTCGGGGRRDSVTVVDDEELEEEAFLAAWAAADENALEVLLEALPHVPTDAVPPLAELQAAVARIRAGVTSQTWPYTYFTAAADWAPAPPHDDLQCFLDAMVSTMLPEAYPDDEWTDDELAAVAALEHAGLGRKCPRAGTRRPGCVRDS
jgi:hypothetical protein